MRGRKKNWPCSSMGFVLLVSKSDGNAQVLQIATSLKAGRKARICVSPRFSETSQRIERDQNEEWKRSARLVQKRVVRLGLLLSQRGRKG